MFKARVAHAPYFYLQIRVRTNDSSRQGQQQTVYEQLCVVSFLVLHLHDPVYGSCLRGCRTLTWAVCVCGACMSCVCAQADAERDVEAWLRRKYEGRIREMEVMLKEDLDLVRTMGGWWWWWWGGGEGTGFLSETE